MKFCRIWINRTPWRAMFEWYQIKLTWIIRDNHKKLLCPVSKSTVNLFCFLSCLLYLSVFKLALKGIRKRQKYNSKESRGLKVPNMCKILATKLKNSWGCWIETQSIRCKSRSLGTGGDETGYVYYVKVISIERLFRGCHWMYQHTPQLCMYMDPISPPPGNGSSQSKTQTMWNASNYTWSAQFIGWSKRNIKERTNGTATVRPEGKSWRRVPYNRLTIYPNR